jgi:hypothetical protein
MKHSKMLVVMLLGLMVLRAVSWAAERRGAQVVVSLTSGLEMQGELVAVKKDFLVLSSSSTSQGASVITDESIAVADVREVKVIRRSKAGTGALIGLAAGAAGGAALALMQGDDSGGWVRFSVGQKIGPYALAFGLLGTATGAIAGVATGSDTIFELAHQPASQVRENLARLSRMAKIQGIQ